MGIVGKHDKRLNDDGSIIHIFRKNGYCLDGRETLECYKSTKIEFKPHPFGELSLFEIASRDKSPF